jgi:hypothetical protein
MPGRAGAAHPHRLGRLGTAGERRGAHAVGRRGQAARARRHGGGGGPGALRLRAHARLCGDPASRSRRGAASRASSTASRRMRCTSRPRGRSAGRCGASASGAACPSPPPSTRSSRTTCSARTRLPPALSWALLRRFHEAGGGTFVATASLGAELASRGFTKVRPWSRGVDLDRFHPAAARRGTPDAWEACPGRSSSAPAACDREEPGAFLSLDLPGHQGRGRRRAAAAALMRRFPGTHFTGWRENGALARAYARPTSSSSHPAPTPSASCCSRRWPPARRSPPSR